MKNQVQLVHFVVPVSLGDQDKKCQPYTSLYTCLEHNNAWRIWNVLNNKQYYTSHLKGSQTLLLQICYQIHTLNSFWYLTIDVYTLCNWIIYVKICNYGRYSPYTYCYLFLTWGCDFRCCKPQYVTDSFPIHNQRILPCMLTSQVHVQYGSAHSQDQLDTRTTHSGNLVATCVNT